MAYVRGDTTPIESSASFLPCNLSVIMKDEEKDEGLVFGIIHKHIINIGILGLDSSTQNLVSNGRLEDKNPSSHVTQARWCKMANSRVILVLTSYKGFLILDQKGSKALYSNKLETPPGALNSRFTKGVASVGNLLTIGTSEGPILVFSMSEDGEVELNKQLEGHLAPVSDIVTDTSGTQLLSADEQGVLILWEDISISTKPSITINDTGGVPCLCLAFWKTFIIGGFANGQLRLYDSESGVKVAEVTAHARPVMAIDVAPLGGLLLSASEDCTVTIWSLPVLDNPKLDLVHIEVVDDTLLCGAKFTNLRGTKFAVTAYDSHEIQTFVRKSTPV